MLSARVHRDGTPIAVPADVDAITSRIIMVDYLRGLAALSVAWIHLTNTYQTGRMAYFLGSFGHIGVQEFFVISGFIIPWSIRFTKIKDPVSFTTYLGRRVIRVEIPYLVSIALVVGLAYASSVTPGFAGSRPEWTFAQIALHVVYLVPFSTFDWLNIVYWTLALEFVFYISLGLLSYPVVRQPTPGAFVCICLILFAACRAGALSPMFLYFILGIVAFRRHHHRDHGILSAVLSAVTAAIIVTSGQSWPEAGAGLVTMSTIIVLGRYRLSSPCGSLLGFLGAISYSLYLVHVPIGGRIVNLGRRVTSSEVGEVMMSLAGLLASVVFAWIFYRLVERPAHALARQLPKG